MDEEIEVESRLAAMEGVYSGHEGLRRWWDDVVETIPDYRVEMVEVRNLGDAAIAHLRGTGSGVASSTPIVDPFWQAVRWGRDGKLRLVAQLLDRGRGARGAGPSAGRLGTASSPPGTA